MNDQRSLNEQLVDVAALADERGMYDAADFIRRAIAKPAQAMRECVGCGCKWFEGFALEHHLPTCPIERTT